MNEGKVRVRTGDVVVVSELVTELDSGNCKIIQEIQRVPLPKNDQGQTGTFAVSPEGDIIASEDPRFL